MYERSHESGTEANYDMVDGQVNNQKKDAEIKQNPAAKRPKKRTSVIKKLHEKQIAIAKRSGKPVPKYLEQQMVQEIATRYEVYIVFTRISKLKVWGD